MHFYYDADDKINSMSYAGEMYYYVTNLQGDVTKLVKSDGTVAANYEYDAWGKLLSVTDANGKTIGSSLHIGLMNPLRYRGYVYDDETGLYYLQSRYYDPTTGRFVNANGVIDIDVILSSNLFIYCWNSPINYSDESGEWPSFSAKKINSNTLKLQISAKLSTIATFLQIGAAVTAIVGIIAGILSAGATVVGGLGIATALLGLASYLIDKYGKNKTATLWAEIKYKIENKKKVIWLFGRVTIKYKQISITKVKVGGGIK